MLQNIKTLYGIELHASDGQIGHVHDFYFNDQDWAVRYVVADTGTWLTGRQVLLSPHSFDSLQQGEKLLQVNLTRKQIEESPSIESDKPVSRQFEDEYYQYYGLPCYWQGEGLWNASPVPLLEIPAKPFPNKLAAANRLRPKKADEHLRSALAVHGYRLEASDGNIGHVSDFLMDTQSWTLPRLVIKTGWLPGKEVEIPTSKVDRISYDESTVFVNLTGTAVERSPLHHLISKEAVS
jgi:hypothetical protein